MTDDQVREEHQAFQNDLSKTSSVLVIGGVPARIEFAGEVVALYPPKKITVNPPYAAHPSGVYFCFVDRTF